MQDHICTHTLAEVLHDSSAVGFLSLAVSVNDQTDTPFVYTLRSYMRGTKKPIWLSSLVSSVFLCTRAGGLTELTKDIVLLPSEGKFRPGLLS